MKKKKKKKAPKEGDDEFSAKLAALDINKEGGEDEEVEQEGDMYVDPSPFSRTAIIIAEFRSTRLCSSSHRHLHRYADYDYRKAGTGIWSHDDVTAIKYDLLLVCT